MVRTTSDPLAYLLTWTTYGTWLPGDRRGWVDQETGGPEVPIQRPNTALHTDMHRRLKGLPVVLSNVQRRMVDETIREVCCHRCLKCHAVNCRSNHVHVVVTAVDRIPERVLSDLKAWCSRRLNKESHGDQRRRWWTRHGSTRYLNSERSVFAAVDYVLNQQVTRSLMLAASGGCFVGWLIR